MIMTNRKTTRRDQNMPGKKLAAAVAGATMLLCNTSAMAFEFKTGSDLSARWDNTLKYNLMYRVADQDKDVYGDPALGPLADDSDLAFDKGVVSNRVDVLSELDVIWKDTLGFRVSGAGWYDHAYDGNSDATGVNDALGGINTWGALSAKPGEFTDAAKDLHKVDAELLDAFLFTNITTGDVETGIRAGRHTLFWGQSLLLGGAVHGIAGSMAPIDLAKGFAVPGSEAKELFIPTNKISMATQVTNNLMLSGYYSLEFQEYRLPELGSYFSPAEILTDDSEFFLLKPGVPGVTPRVGLAKVSDETTDSGEFGLNAQYYIENLDLEVGAYYLNYHDKISHGLTGAIDFAKGTGMAPPDVLAADAVGLGEFKWVYKEDVDLFAVSLAKEIAGLSVGMDIVRRENAPLPPDLGASINRLSGVPAGLPIPDYDFDAADGSNYPGPVGDTWHVVVNALGLLNANSIWDGGSYAAEVTVSWLDEVTENEEFLASNVHEGRAVTGVGLLFKPQWFQVLPGTDLTLPMSVSYTIDGEAAPIGNGGNEELGNFSVGAELLVDQAWTASLKYNGFFGPAANGLGGLLKDRDNVSFTIKRTF